MLKETLCFSLNIFMLQNEVATAFEIFWMIFEPILFGLTGTQIVVNNLDLKFVIKGISCVAIAAVVLLIYLIFEKLRKKTGV